MIVPELAALFWNHDTEKLDMQQCKELVILTTLQRGTIEQIQLVCRLFGAAEVQRVFRKDTLGPRTLSAPAVYWLGLLFLREAEMATYKRWHEDPVLRWLPTRTSWPPGSGGGRLS